RSLPAVERSLPESEVRLLGRVLHVLGAMAMYPAELLDHQAPRPVAPEAAVTEAFGAYLATGCGGCHGETLSGGPIPGAPPSAVGLPANLTPHATGLGDWSASDFRAAFREGVRPNGSEIDPAFMPWPAMGRMTDTELDALFLYLQSIEPLEFGNR
ncbi:MAG: cytochrome c, partial [bacterium]|nr:cytochrome c [bacterium]